MSFAFEKILGPARSLMSWVLSLHRDQTKISVIGENPSSEKEELLEYELRSEGENLLFFALTTGASHPVEIQEVSFQYSTPMQLFDPGRLGFFRLMPSSSRIYPFQIGWSGSIDLERNLRCVFAVAVQLPVGVKEMPVRMVIRSRSATREIGGFEKKGRTKVFEKIYVLRPVRNHLPGIPIPPMSHFTAKQLFVLKSQIMAFAYDGDPIKLEIHEQGEDGVASSRIIDEPAPNNSLQGRRP